MYGGTGLVISRSKVQQSPSGDAPFVRALIRVEEMQEEITKLLVVSC